MSSRSNNDDDDERKPPALAPSATLSNDDADANSARVVVAKGEKTPAQIRAITTRVLQEKASAAAKKTQSYYRFLKDDGSEWFRILDFQNYEVSDSSPLYYLDNPNNLVYNDPDGDCCKVCLSFPQDDNVVLNALSSHFTRRKPSMAEVARFFNKYVQFGNWSKFRQRNEETIKRRIIQGQNRRLPPIIADLLDDMETAGRAMPPRDNPAPRAPKTETQDFKSVLEAMQTTSERQLATFRDLSDRQATMFRDTTTEQRLAGERQAEMFRNLTTEQRVANDNNLAALLASQQAEREQNAMNQQAEREQNAKNLKMLADSQTKQLSMLAKSIRSKSAPRGGSPRIVHAATERKANRARVTPTSINPRRLVVTPAKTPAKTPAVKRVLKDGCSLPTNQRGDECGHCRKAWEKRYAFCAHHETLLGERSEVE